MDEASLLEKYRYINVEYSDWCTFVYDDFIKECGDYGIQVDGDEHNGYAITWSGFWSQGDGAAFDGCVNDWDKFLTESGLKTPITDKYLNELHGGMNISWGNSSRYPNVSFNDFDYSPISEHLEEDHPLGIIWDAVQQDEINAIYDEIKWRVNKLCDNLYAELESQYEFLTSDDIVWESIVANELDKECDDE